MTKDIYQDVTDRMIAALENGTIPWHKPWVGGGPVNVRSGRPYRGINIWLLELESMTAGYSDNRWGTFKAIKEAGGQVRKGEKGTRVILWKPVPKGEDADGNEQSYWLLREYTVFNVEQADGIEPLVFTDDVHPNKLAEDVLAGYASPIGPPVVTRGSKAAYQPMTDIVYMPPRPAFDGGDEFYSTLFHELAHSTGHEKRLDRIEPALFGTDPYAKEELVAELAAAMLSGVTGITGTFDNSAAYVAHWVQRFKDDRKLIVSAAAQAQKAADLILGTTFETEEQPAPEGALAA